MHEESLSLLSRSYAPAVQQRLSRLPSRDQLSIGAWLTQNPVGTNYALQILDGLEDLARREDSAPAKLFQQILSSVQPDKLQPKEIGRRIRDELDRRIHPQSRGHQEAFVTWTEGLGLPEGLRVVPPQNFEGNFFSLNISFASTEELRSRLQGALDLIKKPGWERLWEF